MKIGAPIACFALGVTMQVLAGTQSAAASSTPGDTALAKWADAWAKVQTYTVRMTGREVKGNDVQDRVYNFYYAAPNHVRMDVVSGAGRGSQVVWTGGDTIYGHKGGILRFFKMHLNLTDPSVVSMRGVTIAQSTFGALLDMIRGLKKSSTSAASAGATTTFTAIVADPSSDGGITKDVIYLATSGLPTGYDQYEGDVDVNHMTYTDTKVNVPLPASTWNI